MKGHTHATGTVSGAASRLRSTCSGGHSGNGHGHNHVVQFYENERYLAAAVTDFLAAGLAAGQPLIVIATEGRRRAFADGLGQRGYDVDRASVAGELTMLDAREMLSVFMSGGVPNPERFRSAVGGVLTTRLSGRGGAGARLYGEMVDLLWADGNTDGALRLEGLWNELAGTHDFSLLCAYALGHFYREEHTPLFDDVCRAHSHVVPADRPATDDRERLLELSRLQQRARALEAEVEHRKALELRLREALAARLAAEEALKRGEHELREFLENAAEGIHWVGPDGIIQWANKAELELLGYAAGEYVGHHIARFHDDQKSIADILARLSRGETLHEHEARLRCKDGSVKHVLINSNVLWRDGKFVHTRCFTRDITELKLAAAERERLLEGERAARAEAEAASRAKSEFLAVMSHELRTPLNAIGGHTQLIELGVYGPVTEAQHEALGRVQRSQRHLLSLINDLLNMARIESGRLEFVLDDVALEALLDDVSAMVAPLLAAKQLTCEVAPAGRARARPVVVRADREKVGQILLNLVTNAIKFTPSGGRIGLDVASCADAPAMACVRVSDTGIGIPASKLESIFEPFVQLASRRTDQPEGVGLGLAISRDLARGMGGDLSAASTPGAGSTFTLRLPLA